MPNPNPPAGTPRENAQVNDPTCAESFADNTYWEAVPTPNAVEEAMAERGWKLASFDEISAELDRLSGLARIYAFHAIAHDRTLSIDGDTTIADANALCRTQAFAEVRRVVEGMQSYDTPQYDDIGMQQSHTGQGEWVQVADVFVALDALERGP